MTTENTNSKPDVDIEIVDPSGVVDTELEHTASNEEIEELSPGSTRPADADPEGAEVDLDDLEERAGRVDTELEEAHTEADREKIRAERRASKKQRVERAKEREAALRREAQMTRQQLEEANRRLAALEGNSRGAQLGNLEQTAGRIDHAISTLEATLAEAVQKQDGQTAALATRRIQEALEARRNIGVAIEQFKATINKPPQQAVRVDPAVITHSQDWVNRNKWYKGPNSTEQDSAILTMLDNAVSSEGFNPSTKEYWDELDARMKKYLPHRAGVRDNSAVNRSSTNTARQPVAGAGNNGSGGAGATNGGKRTIQLSAERVRAMKEAGSWDDPKRKADMIRRFQEQDARDAARRS